MTNNNTVEKYPLDYKHLDNLIWRLPGWSTAIFVLSLMGLSFLAKDDLKIFDSNISPKTICIGFLFICTFFLAVITHALVRFRDHQWGLRPSESIKYPKVWYGAQFWLQIVVISQTCSLAFLTAAIAFKKTPIALLISVILGLFLLIYSNLMVYYRVTLTKKGNPNYSL